MHHKPFFGLRVHNPVSFSFYHTKINQKIQASLPKREITLNIEGNAIKSLFWDAKQQFSAVMS